MFTPASLLDVIQVMDVEACASKNLDDKTSIKGYQIDSRLLKSGQVFFAFIGKQSDGHNYLEKAEKARASCAIVTRFTDANIPQIKVKDPLAVIIHLARVARNRWPKSRNVVAITGSVGKTSTKAFCYQVLSSLGKTHQTLGNQNNMLGLSLSILNTPEDTKYAVLELGINARYEMEVLADICKPDCAIITNIAACHLEKLKSLSRVANEKGSLFAALSEHALAIIPESSTHTDILVQKAHTCHKKFYGISSLRGDIQVSKLQLNEKARPSFTMHYQGHRVHCQLQVVGEHQVHNALAVATCALAYGADLSSVSSALEQVQTTENRMQLTENGKNGAWLLLDAYNASPLSIKKALQALEKFPKKDKCLILGDMAELGDDAMDLHHEVGQQANACGVTHLLTYGDLAVHAAKTFTKTHSHYTSIDDLRESIQDLMHNEMVILIKGSRKMQLNRLTSALVLEQEVCDE